jgi:hypothetical protein
MFSRVELRDEEIFPKLSKDPIMVLLRRDFVPLKRPEAVSAGPIIIP